ncbi:MAG TPA: hypothetical protein VJP79_04065 [Nitrososphaera sp.]|nr:hypothetical protein [Nitrososphaera sp.]
MSEYRFTDGNLIILYAVHTGRTSDGTLPDYIKERVKVGLETYGIVMTSRPDKHKTMVIIVGEQGPAGKIKDELVSAGVDGSIIAIDSDSKNISQTVDRIYELIQKKPNPPFVYFVGSVWNHETLNSATLSKMKGYRVQFYGALDHRPVAEVEQEKALDRPKQGVEHFKQKAKNKAVDVLLNVIFPD